MPVRHPLHVQADTRRIACGSNWCTVGGTGGTGAMCRHILTKRADFERRLLGWCYDWTRYE